MQVKITRKLNCVSFNLISLLIFFLINIHSLNIFAQRLIDRNFIIQSTHDSIPKGRIGAYGKFGMHRLIRDNNHGWLQEVGIIIDLMRNHFFNFHGESLIEFIADPNNDIRFNPRAIFWQEGLYFSKQLENHFLVLGYFHRCKHDIDNYFLNEERTLIYASITLKHVINIQKEFFDDFKIQNRLDIYTVRNDYRTPKTFSKTSIDNLFLSSGSIIYAKKTITPEIECILKLNFLISFFSYERNFFKQVKSPSSFQFNYGFSTGINLKRFPEFLFIISYEFLNDSGISINSDKSRLLSFSMLFSTSNLIF